MTPGKLGQPGAPVTRITAPSVRIGASLGPPGLPAVRDVRAVTRQGIGLFLGDGSLWPPSADLATVCKVVATPQVPE